MGGSSILRFLQSDRRIVVSHRDDSRALVLRVPLSPSAY